MNEEIKQAEPQDEKVSLVGSYIRKEPVSTSNDGHFKSDNINAQDLGVDTRPKRYTVARPDALEAFSKATGLSDEDAQRMCDWMYDAKLDPSKASAWVLAYKALEQDTIGRSLSSIAGTLKSINNHLHGEEVKRLIATGNPKGQPQWTFSE